MAKVRLPAFIQKQADIDGFDAAAVEMPRLKLLQKSSPELAACRDAHPGDFFHDLTGEGLGSAVRICPVYIDCRVILWRPLEAGGGILARADDGKHWLPADTEFTVKLKNGREVRWRTARTVRASGLDKRGSYDPDDPHSPPAAERVYAIVCAFPDRRNLSPAVVLLQRAAAKAANKLVGTLKVLKAPSFGVVLEMTSLEERSPSGTFYNHAFEVFGPLEDRGSYEDNFAQYRFFLEHGLKVKDLDAAQDDNRSAAWKT